MTFFHHRYNVDHCSSIIIICTLRLYYHRNTAHHIKRVSFTLPNVPRNTKSNVYNVSTSYFFTRSSSGNDHPITLAFSRIFPFFLPPESRVLCLYRRDSRQVAIFVWSRRRELRLQQIHRIFYFSWKSESSRPVRYNPSAGSNAFYILLISQRRYARPNEIHTTITSINAKRFEKR